MSLTVSMGPFFIDVFTVSHINLPSLTHISGQGISQEHPGNCKNMNEFQSVNLKKYILSSTSFLVENIKRKKKYIHSKDDGFIQYSEKNPKSSS